MGNEQGGRRNDADFIGNEREGRWIDADFMGTGREGGGRDADPVGNERGERRMVVPAKTSAKPKMQALQTLSF